LETADIGGGLTKPSAEVSKYDRKLLGNMERGLHERDRVGVQDFVLLEDFRSELAFIDNLRKRFKEDLIYVSKKHN
jgi:myosin-1